MEGEGNELPGNGGRGVADILDGFARRQEERIYRFVEVDGTVVAGFRGEEEVEGDFRDAQRPIGVSYA